MADTQFFLPPKKITLSEVLEISGAKVSDEVDLDGNFLDVMSLDTANSDHVSFLDNVKYKNQFLKTNAGACFVHSDIADKTPKGTIPLISASPYKSYALLAQAFYPLERGDGYVSDAALIDDKASIADGCTIEAGAIIKAGVKIGSGSWIESGAVISKNVDIGKHCRIGANACISHAILGDHVRLYPGACVGQDGFGFAIDPAGHVKVPQLGRVIIEDHVEIGANTTIDRGSGPDTVIGQGAWIDNQVQIGHNVKIGRGCIIVSQAGVSGSAVLDDFVALGGQVGVAGHLHIGKGARIAAKSGIMRDVLAGEEQMGYPALPIKQFMRQIATLNRLIKKGKTS